MSIHPTAVIHPSAQIADNVTIDAFCVVGEHVTLAQGVHLHSHVVVQGRTSIGEHTAIFPFAVVGAPPQDLKYKGEHSTLSIGARCNIREHVTIHPGTEGGGMHTSVGNDCLLMVASHIAHDCIIGNNVILANNATLAGHVEVGDFAVIGGLAGVHQFVRIGAHAMIGGATGVDQDVIPYGSVIGERGWLAGLNLVGMKRRGMDRTDIHNVRSLFRALFDDNEGTLAERVSALASHEDYQQGAAADVLNFLQTDSKRAFLSTRFSDVV